MPRTRWPALLVTTAAAAAAAIAPAAATAAPWSAPQTLGPAVGGVATAPAVVSAPDGTTVTLYGALAGDGHAVATAVIRRPGQASGTPQTLSAAGTDASTFDIATDPAGDVTAIWQRGGII